MSTDSNQQKARPVGRIQGRLMKRFQLEAKYLSDQAQCDPVRILFGRDRLSMTQIFPACEVRKEGGSDGGKDSAKDGSAENTATYFGKTAFSFCVGPVYKIFAIWNGDEQYADYTDGLILSDETETTGVGIEGLGGFIRIHRGKPDAQLDPLFKRDLKCGDGQSEDD